MGEKLRMAEYFSGGGFEQFTLQYWSPDVEAMWSICDDDQGGMQVIYKRKDFPKNGETEDFWLYLSPCDAEVLGRTLLAFAKARRSAIETQE